MSVMHKIFHEHPESVGETYGEHLVQASGFAGRLFVASIACFLHGLLPCLFKRTGSDAIRELHHRMVTHRTHQTPGASERLAVRQGASAGGQDGARRAA